MDGPLPRSLAPAAHAGFVTIAAFSQPIEAHLARGRLECEGVACRILDEHIVSVAWLWSAALGGVKLQVAESDRARACALLAEKAPAGAASSDWITEDLQALRCPGCGSLRVQEERFDRRLVFASWLLLGIPLPFLRRGLACRICGLRWRAARRPIG